MRKISIVIAAAALLIGAQADASLYNISFSGGGWSASGQINVSGGVATTGYLDVNYGATTKHYGYLATGWNYLNWNGNIVTDNNGDNAPIGDNLVNTAGPIYVDQYGLLFVTSPVNIIAPNNQGFAAAVMYLSADQNNGYVPNLNGYGNALAGFGWGNPNVDGTLTLTAVPEPTTIVAGALLLLPFGASTLRMLRKSRKV